jgi:hypothetical protein
LSAKRLRKACSGGTILEPGGCACSATCLRSKCCINGTNKNSPATRVRNERGVRSSRRILLVPKLVTEHPKGTRRVSKSTCRLGRREVLDEVGPQGLVLAMEGIDRLEEKPGLIRMRC